MLIRLSVAAFLLFCAGSSYAACTGGGVNPWNCDTQEEAYDATNSESWSAYGPTQTNLIGPDPHWSPSTGQWWGLYTCSRVDDGSNCHSGQVSYWRDLRATCSWNSVASLVECSDGYEPGKTCGKPQCGVGNPIDVGTGNKYQREPDLHFSDLLKFERHYNSESVAPDAGLGWRWTHTYSSRLTVEHAGLVHLHRPDGRRLAFRRDVSTGQWAADPDVTSALEELLDGSSQRVGWRFAEIDNRQIETYDALGRLESIERNDGHAVTLVHNGGAIENSVDDFKVTTVMADDGRALQFTWDTSHRIASIEGPDGGVMTFAYDSAGRLSAVDAPGTDARTYHYGEAEHIGIYSFPLALTGITDENGDRFATFTYGRYEKALSTAYAGGANTFSLSAATDGSVSVTTPGGATTIRTFVTLHGVRRVASEVTSCTGCATRSRTFTYDANGHRDVVTDAGGFTTDYDHDSRGLPTQVTEAANDTAGVRRTIQTDWHPTFAVPTERRVYDAASTLVAKTTWTYNARGQVLTATQIDPSTLGSRTTAVAYCEATDVALPASICPILGRLKSVDGPRTDVSDLTTYTYRAATDISGCATGGTCHRLGDLWKVTDALGLVTTIERHDAAGRVTRMLDANGVAVDVEYDARGRMTARKVRGTNDSSESDDAITAFVYDNVGQVTEITAPDGATVSFEYDTAHRLEAIEDDLGNRIEYALDAAGNRYQEDTRDTGGILRRTLSRLFDDLGQLETVADASDNATDFTYGLDGNLDTATDALGRVTDNDHDALGRLRESIANVAGSGAERAVSQFDYNALDQLTGVTDPNGLTTAYDYNAFGDLLELDSPDTGTTEYDYDAAGNRTGELDARGVQTGYSYDAVGRLTGIDRPTSGQDITFTWDSAPAACQTGETFALGRLGTMADASGSTQTCYDRRGNLVRKVQATNGLTPTRTIVYGYDLADRVISMTYPSGATVNYTRDATGRITAVSAQPTSGATAVTLVSDIDYLPFGPATLITFGNGRTLTKDYDLDYAIASVFDNTTDGLEIEYGKDEVGNIVALSQRQQGGIASERIIDYDGLDRIESFREGATPIQTFEYDATGNRTKKNATVYHYASGTHHLTGIGSAARTYDAAGHGTGLSIRTFTYDDAGRMAEHRANGVLTREYAYNGRGERVAKQVTGSPGSDTYFVYDESGHLIGEYRGNGGRVREYVWLDDTPIAILDAHVGTTYQYVLSDHLNTPRAIVRPDTNVIVWRWNITGSAFGDHAYYGDPDGDSVNYTMPLRYPGQYHDTDTGLFYNYFRDYDPAVGRYVQSDPVGLDGGISTYAYAHSSTFRYADRLGLRPGDLFRTPQAAAGDMYRFIAENSLPGGRFRQDREVAGWIRRAGRRCYTYGDDMVEENEQRRFDRLRERTKDDWGLFHSHELRPHYDQIRAEPTPADVSAGNREAFGPQIVGSIVFSDSIDPNTGQRRSVQEFYLIDENTPSFEPADGTDLPPISECACY